MGGWVVMVVVVSEKGASAEACREVRQRGRLAVCTGHDLGVSDTAATRTPLAAAAADSDMGLPPGLGDFAAILCTTPEFSQHCRQLEADHSLSASLVGSLLRGLCTAAVILRLPQDRQSGGGLEWGVVERLVGALSSPPLPPALRHHAASADDASLLRVLRSSATVLQLLPGPASVEELRRSCNVAFLLAGINKEVMQRGMAEQAAVVLLPLLPCVTRLLQLGTKLGFPGAQPAADWGPLLHTWMAIACSFTETCKAAELPGGAAAAPAWCAFGAEACRLLPLLAAAAPQLAGYPTAQAPVVPALVEKLLCASIAAASAAVRYTQQGSAPSAELASASVLLFEASCRAVHWSAAAPAMAAAALPHAEQPTVPLLLLLCGAFVEASQLDRGLLGAR